MGSSLWVLSSPDIIWGRLGTLCLGTQTCENGEVHCLDFSGPKPCEVPEFTTRRWSLWERTTNQWVEISFGFWGPLHAIWWFEKSATVNGCFLEKLKKTLSYGYSFRDQQQRQGECWNIQSTRFNGCIPPTNPWRSSSAWHTMLLFAFTTVVLDMWLQRIHLTICWFFTRPRTHMGLLFLKQRW